jgi:hypothetical protein
MVNRQHFEVGLPLADLQAELGLQNKRYPEIRRARQFSGTSRVPSPRPTDLSAVKLAYGMRFQTATEPWVLRSYIPELVSLAGEGLWKKRTSDLRSFGRSPYLERVASDYHWVELQLDDELAKRENAILDADSSSDPISCRALRFAQTICEVHKSLHPAGKRRLEGRIRDALQAETGFAALYQEMEIAAVLVRQNFDVGFPDLDGSGRADISFQQGTADGLIECKALSADAGRKIHRKHFYRFMLAISQEVLDRLSRCGRDELILITLKDRLPPNIDKNTPLVQATKNLIRSSEVLHIAGDDFDIVREPYSKRFGILRPMAEQEFYAAAQEQFGANCHIAGGSSQEGGCLFSCVVKSKTIIRNRSWKQ